MADTHNSPARGYVAVNGRNLDTHELDSGTASPLGYAGSHNSFLDASGEHEEILKVLDELRTLDIDSIPGDHSLPQIIVCGAQSSGKSSVLEAIAGIPFPRKAGVCTKYKTQVTLLRHKKASGTISIKPDRYRPREEADRLRAFEEGLDQSNLADSITIQLENANRLIFSGSMAKKTFTNDTVCITLAGPTRKNLQLLDLPGLILVDTEGDGSTERVKAMVQKEMTKQNSIVLAVAKATDDLQRHEILQMCKDLGVESWRSLGVLTMPDKPDAHSYEYVQIVRGEHEQFKKFSNIDWHVLLNRDGEELVHNTSSALRDEKEKHFFETRAPWNRISPLDRGIDALRDRLSALLFTVAKRELPNIYKKMALRKGKLDADLERLGGDLSDKILQKTFQDSVDRLKEKTRDHGRGYYFSDLRSYNGSHEVHLRSRVYDRSEAFRDRLFKSGRAWILEGRDTDTLVNPHLEEEPSVYKEPAPSAYEATPHPESKTLEAVVEHFVNELNSMRAKGLPGFSNENVINKQFWRLTEGWGSIAETHVDDIFRCCTSYFQIITPQAFSKNKETRWRNHISGFSNGDIVADRFCSNYLLPALETCRDDALVELAKLEQDRLDVCQSFNDTFWVRFREERATRQKIRAFKISDAEDELNEKEEIEARDIAKLNGLYTRLDWTTETAREHVVAMLTHYDLVCQVFVDNVITQVVERHLMRNIHRIIQNDLELAELRELTRAEPGVEQKKAQIRKDLELLKLSMDVLKPFSYGAGRGDE